VNAVRKLHSFGFFKNVSRPDAYDRLSRCFWRSETATLVSTRLFGSWSDGGGGAAAAAAAAATSSSWSSLGFDRGFSSSQSGILIKALRERTGAPIKDVKAVLEQCGWDSGIGFSQLLYNPWKSRCFVCCSSCFSSVFLLRVGYGVVVDGNCIARRVWRTMLQLSRPAGSQ
jgi:hypothetical protein